jgi:hypothetical protein
MLICMGNLRHLLFNHLEPKYMALRLTAAPTSLFSTSNHNTQTTCNNVHNLPNSQYHPLVATQRTHTLKHLSTITTIIQSVARGRVLITISTVKFTGPPKRRRRRMDMGMGMVQARARNLASWKRGQVRWREE